MKCPRTHILWYAYECLVCAQNKQLEENTLLVSVIWRLTPKAHTHTLARHKIINFSSRFAYVYRERKSKWNQFTQVAQEKGEMKRENCMCKRCAKGISTFNIEL